MEQSAIEAAAENLKKKLHHQHSHTKGRKNLTPNCCDTLALEVNAGRRSPIMIRREVIHDGMKRPLRQGVSQRNPTEGKLLTEAMKYLKIQENLDEWNIVQQKKSPK